MKINNSQKNVIYIIAIMSVISIILALFTKLSLLQSIRIIFGSVYVLFLPGFILTYIFFPKTKLKEGIDIIERIALSFALSIAVVPLVVFYLNLIGLKISALNTFLIILGIIVVELAIIYHKNKKIQ